LALAGRSISGRHFSSATTVGKPLRYPAMTELSLRKSGRRREDHYDVIADGSVVGRIMFFSATPNGSPWMWTIAPGYGEDRSRHAATLEAATQAFARSWYRD
jgi:hypothetical protein